MPIVVQSLAEWEAAGQVDVLSVVIPAYNEEGHIADTIEGLVSAFDAADITHDILVINDNSNDQTENILKSLANKHAGVRYLNNAPPNGFGFAVRAGLAAFKGECVAIVMADGSDDPQDVAAFYQKWREGFDCVFGTRFHRKSKRVDYPRFKYFVNRLGNIFIQILFLTKYNDTTNAFKLYGRNVIAGLQPLLSNQFNLTVELPLKAMVRGYEYAIVPNNWYQREQGASKFRIKEIGSRYLFIILYCWLEKRLSQRDYVKQHDKHHLQLQVWHR